MELKEIKDTLKKEILHRNQQIDLIVDIIGSVSRIMPFLFNSLA